MSNNTERDGHSDTDDADIPTIPDRDRLEILDEYQEFTRHTAQGIADPDDDSFERTERINHLALGVAGESGELVELIKKRNRREKGDGQGQYVGHIRSEIADVLWYLTRVCDEVGVDMSDALRHHIGKLEGRVEDGTIHAEEDRSE
jgi:NTP pyrophosphatase (non-canonical NTP hydrolase)